LQQGNLLSSGPEIEVPGRLTTDSFRNGRHRYGFSKDMYNGPHQLPVKRCQLDDLEGREEEKLQGSSADLRSTNGRLA
jgi:hypothetical protein